MSDTSERRPRRHEKAAWREVDDEIFVTAPDGETVFTLDQVAASIWRLCDGDTDVPGLVEKLMAEYEIDRETLTTDVDEFLIELAGQELII